jgi:hypothetical protein
MDLKERYTNARLMQLELEHSKCYTPQQCGIGLNVRSDFEDGKPVVKLVVVCS